MKNRFCSSSQVFLGGCLTAMTVILSSLLPQLRLQAQIIPDRTLPNNSLVIPNDNNIRIEGGTRAGGNLFHSFDEFSVPTNSEVFFNNSLDIRNILSRVTGGSVSNIDGLIRANGNANLFLINPRGIVFGPHARLDIGGSFVGSSASSIEFLDGSAFSAVNPQTSPLLTVNIPIGLNFRGLPGEIRVQGKGHNLNEILLSPIDGGSSDFGLRVKPGNTLALVGGDIVLDGGILTAESGQIELGAVDNGLVSLSPQFSGFLERGKLTLGYESVQSFRTIRLSEQALVDASGIGRSSIQVQGSRIRLTDGSLILVQNQGTQPGDILIKASELIELSGTSPDAISTDVFEAQAAVRSGFNNQTFGLGDGGDITVSTRRLVITDGGSINTRNFGTTEMATGGDIILDVSELFLLSGFSPVNPELTSNIGATTNTSGDAGDIMISTRRLALLNGSNIGNINTATSTGDAGNIEVNATDSVEIIGVNRAAFFQSSLLSSTLSEGKAGDVTINTQRLVLRDGGRIDSSTLASGDAGNLNINARESIEVSGSAPGFINPTQIISSANILDESVRQLIGVPDFPEGISGNVTINTPRLRVTDTAQVTVRNDGTGDAGNLTINARSIFLNREGALTAFSQSGEGGNISLENVRILRMRRSSEISTEALEGKEDAGNIIIDADIIVGLENSDISANALGGNGGNINIRSQGIFGSEFRQEETSKSDITASSQFGVDGTVQINDPDVEPDEGLIELPENVVDAASIITEDICAQGANSEFFITGKGGVPRKPNESSDGGELMVGLVNSAPSNIGELEQKAEISSGSEERQIVPARGWIFQENGEVVLVSYNPTLADSQRPYNPTLIPHRTGICEPPVVGDR